MSLRGGSKNVTKNRDGSIFWKTGPGKIEPSLFFSLSFSTFILAAVISSSPVPLYAGHDENFAYMGRGLYRIVTAAFQIPRYLLYKTFHEPIGLGTIDGVLSGAYYAVAELAGGTLDIGRGAVPYAKYLVFFI